MNTIQESIQIQADQVTVFQAYVGHIDQWWPRMGSYRYTFAPRKTEPRHIRFEQKLNGRFYEQFADGTEYTIGHITAWEPPRRLAYTWQDPKWNGPSTVDVTFVEEDGQTAVTVTHTGFGENGVPAVAAGYQAGLVEIIAAFKEWVRQRETAVT